MFVSVNLSAQMLTSAADRAALFSAIVSTRADLSRLHLLVSEKVKPEAMQELRGDMEALHARGVSWNIDDVGGDCASISMLRELPLSGLYSTNRSPAASLSAIRQASLWDMD